MLRAALRHARTVGFVSASLSFVPAPAEACGGFFCGRSAPTPVDQVAERILFEVGEDRVTMTTQITYDGDAADFAWVLPLGEVPVEGSLAVFHQAALMALDNGTVPFFMPPENGACYLNPLMYCAGCNRASTVSPEDAIVTVHVRAEVGEYDVAVIESSDPEALVAWLRAEGYRITPAMQPYIERYTSEGLKFLALKLLETADVNALRPFRFSLPGTTPTIPLRMTALAAEPEMGIVVFVLADQRFEGKNWPNLTISDDQIRYGSRLPLQTNWPRLVAQSVDAAGGQGWVTDVAGPSLDQISNILDQRRADGETTDEELEAFDDLLDALDRHPYFTRLYTRLSAEEMTSDPVLGRSSLGDVPRQRDLSRELDGVDQCVTDTRVSGDPCEFATCGAGGVCVPVSWPGDVAGTPLQSAGCGCVPGATARKTIAPDGSDTVVCQDARMSFLNPGDREEGRPDVLPDACAGVDCGEHGRCAAVNMTPTCVCDQGLVAAFDPRSTPTGPLTCVIPDEPIARSFYDQRLAALPSELPGGRSIDVEALLARADAPLGADVPVPRPVLGIPPGPTVLHIDGGCGLARRAPSGPGLIGLALAALASRSRRIARR
jgi:hypothetical protein